MHTNIEPSSRGGLHVFVDVHSIVLRQLMDAGSISKTRRPSPVCHILALRAFIVTFKSFGRLLKFGVEGVLVLAAPTTSKSATTVEVSGRDSQLPHRASPAVSITRVRQRTSLPFSTT